MRNLVPEQRQELSMRRRMLDRIYAMKKADQFSKSLMRWKNHFVDNKHISEVDFEKMNDADLFDCFERLVRKYYMSM